MREIHRVGTRAMALHPSSLYCVFIYTWSLPLQGELPKSSDVSTSCPVPSIVLTYIPQTTSISNMPCTRPDKGNTGNQDKGPAPRSQASGEDRAKDPNNSSWRQGVGESETPWRGLSTTSELSFEGRVGPVAVKKLWGRW